MPIIASSSLHIFGNDDKSIRLVELIKERIGRDGCVEAEELSGSIGDPVDNIKEALRTLSGEVQCSSGSGTIVCCKDMEKLISFTKALKKLRGK